MRLAATAFTLCLFVFPAVVWGQGGYGSSPPHSIIQPAGYGWRNNVIVPDGCGCSVPVRADCYDQPCCFRCGLHPLCFLQRVHRMLDCLLPCHMCCGCRPLGCLLGGRCGGCGGCGGGCCGVNCCGPSCCTPGSGLPGFSDPFLDDPVPPKPVAEPAREVRYHPMQGVTPVQAARSNTLKPGTPWKVTSPGAPPADAIRSVQQPASQGGLRVTARPAAPRPMPGRMEQSVLRRTAAEEPAPLPAIEAARPIVRSQSPDESSDDVIPHNPLRGR
jgi:hypothetical protein